MIQQQQQHTQTHFKKCLLSAFRAESKAFHFHLLTRTTLLVDVIWILSPVFTVQCYVSSMVIGVFFRIVFESVELWSEWLNAQKSMIKKHIQYAYCKNRFNIHPVAVFLLQIY